LALLVYPPLDAPPFASTPVPEVPAVNPAAQLAAVSGAERQRARAIHALCTRPSERRRGV